jgi:hypothetical protein
VNAFWFWFAWVLAQAASGAERPPLSASDLKALKESNIFSPHRSRVFERPSSSRDDRRGDSRPSALTTVKPPMLTGIVYDVSLPGHKALVEDRNSESLRRVKTPTFLKAGEELLGLVVEEVRADGLLLKTADGTLKELAVGDPLPLPETAGSAGGESEPAAKPLEEGVRNEILERLKGRIKKKGRPQDEDP